MTTLATLPPAVRRRCSPGPWAAALAWGAMLGAIAAADVPVASGRAAGSSRRPVVDPAVVQAGGCGHGHCGPGGCRHEHARHHRDCRNGVCAPYCPVRPSTFGFHGTQWRRWPGQAVVPVSSEQAVTPATPPRLEVPRANEESLGPATSDLPPPAVEPPPQDAPAAEPFAVPEEPPAPIQPPVAPEPEGMPAEPAEERDAAEPMPDESTPAEPRELPRGEDEPATPPERTAPAEPAPRPEDENLFDESATRRVRRRIPVAIAARSPAATEGESEPAVRVTVHEQQHDAPVEPEAAADDEAVIPTLESSAPRRGWLAVPRVAFDPAVESGRLRAAEARAKKSGTR